MNLAKAKYDNESSYYEKVMRAFNYVQSMQDFLKSLDIALKEGARILDLGCGTGFATVVLKEKYPKAEIVGFDFSQPMLAVCRSKLPKIELINGDFNNGDLNLLKGQFDLVLSTGALSEYAELGKVLPQVKNLLKKNGVLLVIGIRRGIIGWIQSKMWHFHLVGRDGFMRAAKRAGFSNVSKVKIQFRFFPTSVMKFAVKIFK